MNKRKSIVATLCLGLPALLLAGCVSGPEPTELAFGDSVRQIIKAQTYDPSTLTSPSTAPSTGADGQRLKNVLDGYRTDVSKPTTNNEVAVGVDGARR